MMVALYNLQRVFPASPLGRAGAAVPFADEEEEATGGLSHGGRDPDSWIPCRK